MGYPAQLVAIVGTRSAGATTLVTQLQTMLPGYKLAPRPTLPVGRGAIDTCFQHWMAALQYAASKGQGSVVDGTLDTQMLLVQHE